MAKKKMAVKKAVKKVEAPVVKIAEVKKIPEVYKLKVNVSKELRKGDEISKELYDKYCLMYAKVEDMVEVQ